MSLLLTLGEVLAVVNAEEPGPPRVGSGFRLTVAGAESNVAVGAARLGADVAFAGRVGDDEFGRLARTVLRGEGVGVEALVTDPGAPTGLMVKLQRLPGAVGVRYYRAGSAGSRLSPDDLPDDLLRAASVLHVSGVTPALSESARAAAFCAVEAASAAGALISFDVNYRSRLWTPDVARPVLSDLASRADILFVGEDETHVLTSVPDAPEVLLKRGGRGCAGRFGGTETVRPARRVAAVDPVGAGDAFAAGYLADRLAGRPPADALDTALATGAFAVTQPGDWEGLPRRDELALLDENPETVQR
ncbi:sugar kinase [Actinomadura gamaensis]|uniref:Sugar kinase n=1 Tax=Actinomadura gamaensis TaxID=1763541 RepID=A0ABV9TVP9_9ACTN